MLGMQGIKKGVRLVEWQAGNGIYHEGREDHERKTKGL
jgi:hypothetical protein